MIRLSIDLNETGSYMAMSVNRGYPIIADKTPSGKWQIAGVGMVNGKTTFDSIESLACALGGTDNDD